MRSISRALRIASVVFFALACQAEGDAKKDASGAESDGIAAIEAFIAEQNVDKSKSSWKTSLKRPEKQSFDASKTYKWLLETNLGNIVIQLMPDVAPMHVTSTIYLTKLGFYDEIRFHRVIPGFMAQGGDPTGTGGGGPGYQYAGEFDPKVKHDRGGLLSMANRGAGTDSSQFFLTFKATPWLDGKHTIFGEVVEGKGTLTEMEKRGTRGGRPTEKMWIERATIVVE